MEWDAHPLTYFNPHVHVLAADGTFLPDGRFVTLPAVPGSLLAEGFRRAVLEFRVNNDALSEGICSRMLGWRHSGFSTHNEVRVPAEDAEGRKKLAGTMLRAPMSLEKGRGGRCNEVCHWVPRPGRAVHASLPLTYHPVPDIA